MPIVRALTIGISYIVGGFIPLLPYFYVDKPEQGLLYSAEVTILALLVFGYFKSKVTGQNPIIGSLKVTSIGAPMEVTLRDPMIGFWPVTLLLK